MDSRVPRAVARALSRLSALAYQSAVAYYSCNSNSDPFIFTIYTN